MKKALYVLLAALTIIGMVNCGGGSGSSTSAPKGPELGKLKDYSYAVGYEGDTRIRIAVTGYMTETADNYLFQWYTAVSSTAPGTAIEGETDRDFSPSTAEAGKTWYYVIVKDKKTGGSSTSNRSLVNVWDPAGDTDIEHIIVQNAAMPLWEFTLPEGGTWDKYEILTVQYYISKFSRIALADGSDDPHKVRSRAYGAYIEGDFTVPDQGDANGWGVLGAEPNPGAFRMINWNANPMTNPERAGLNANPNNDFIIDNAKGTAGAYNTLFSAEIGTGAATGNWIKVDYTTDAGMAKDFAKVTQLGDDVQTIYAGAGIFGAGGNNDAWDFYVKNVILVHKDDPTLSILGQPNKSGTSEQLFAGNRGSPKGATTRTVLAGGDESYKDNDGEIMVQFDLDGGIGSFPPIKLDATSGSATLGTSFPSAEPTKANFTFDGWYLPDGETAVTGTTVFTDVVTIVKAKWNANFVKEPFNVDLTGQTVINTTAWDTQYSAGLVIDMGADFNGSLYDRITITCKYYGADGTTEVDTIDGGNFQLKFFGKAAAPGSANDSGALATEYNFGQDATDGAWTKNVPTAAKTGSFKYIAIQSSSGVEGTYPAQYVEVISIVADFND
jgi:hypothetical protein